MAVHVHAEGELGGDAGGELVLDGEGGLLDRREAEVAAEEGCGGRGREGGGGRGEVGTRVAETLVGDLGAVGDGGREDADAGGGGGEVRVEEGAADGCAGEAAVEDAVSGVDSGAATEGTPGEGDAGADIVGVLGEGTGGCLRGEDGVQGGIGVLRDGEDLVVVAHASVEGEGGGEVDVVLEIVGALAGIEGNVLLAEALGVGAEAEEVDRGVDGGAGSVGVGMDVEGGVGDEVNEASGAALGGGGAVVAEGAFLVGECGDVGVDAGDFPAELDMVATMDEGDEVNQLQAALVGVGGAAEVGGGAKSEALGADGDFRRQVAGADGGFLWEGRLGGLVLEGVAVLQA